MLSICMASNPALVFVSLALVLVLLSAQSYAQTLSIISIAPTPVLPSFSSPTFTPNGPSSSFDSLGTGSTPSATITGLSEPTFPPTMTSCFIPPTGTVRSRLTLDPSSPTQPAYAECIEIIHTSDHVIEVELFTVASDGQTLLPLPLPLPTAEPSSSSASSASPHSGIGTGAIVGAVVGAVFGSLLIAATLFWIRKQRRSAKPVGTWINRPAGWVRDEKPPANIIEMNRRDGV